ncbi:MAG: hypothetical protein OEZ04_09255, partial [Nitrospinota bacterium]|nr:hypothetical protein [Nitrospinota bacterium]
SLLYGAALFGEIPDIGSFMAGLMVVGALAVYHHSGAAELRRAMGEGTTGALPVTGVEKQCAD